MLFQVNLSWINTDFLASIKNEHHELVPVVHAERAARSKDKLNRMLWTDRIAERNNKIRS